MNVNIIKAYFGDSGIVWRYKSSIDVGDPIIAITAKFIQAIGDNQIDCNVVNIAGSWYAHTHATAVVQDENFEHFVDLPIPELMIEEIEEIEEIGESHAG